MGKNLCASCLSPRFFPCHLRSFHFLLSTGEEKKYTRAFPTFPHPLTPSAVSPLPVSGIKPSPTKPPRTLIPSPKKKEVFLRSAPDPKFDSAAAHESKHRSEALFPGGTPPPGATFSAKARQQNPSRSSRAALETAGPPPSSAALWLLWFVSRVVGLRFACWLSLSWLSVVQFFCPVDRPVPC